MATWQSADLLSRFNMLAARPSSGDAVSDANKYVRLTDAQNAVIEHVSAIAPKSLYPKGAIPTLSTSDSKVFTFGTDLNSDPLFPIGKVQVYDSLSAVPDSPWVEGVDYLNEGSQIRIPNNRTYGGTLYWRGIAPAIDISASNQPTLLPPHFRSLIVFEAVRRFAEEGGRDTALADRMRAEYDRTFAKFCLVLKTQFKSGGALARVSGLDLSMVS